MTVRAMLPRLLLGFVILAGALWLALNRDQLDPAAIEDAIHNLGLWGPVAHVVLFALGTVLFVPGTLFGLAGGALFGPLWGTILNLAGATVGATAAFLVARYVAADLVRRKAGTRLGRLIKGVEAEGWRFVAFTRLVPLIPFNLLNYALGLTGIPLRIYILTSLVCMLPGAIVYTWLGYAGRSVATGDLSALHYGLLGLGGLALIAFLPRLWRRVRTPDPGWVDIAELQRRLGSGRAPVLIDVRQPEEFAAPPGHLPGAVNIPLADVADRAAELAARQQPIVLVCKTDRRSARAAELLRTGGLRDVTVLRGGTDGWHRQGLALE
jgi:uncharacterized membrane protein YdjX (TVP38/TMEM64 family)/rhodanese-related sulfurtransferase